MSLALPPHEPDALCLLQHPLTLQLGLLLALPGELLLLPDLFLLRVRACAQ